MFPVVTVVMVVTLLRVIKSTHGSNSIVPMVPNGAKNSKLATMLKTFSAVSIHV